MDIFRSKKITKIIPLLTDRYSILCTRRLQPPRDDCVVRVQCFSGVNMCLVEKQENEILSKGLVILFVSFPTGCNCLILALWRLCDLSSLAIISEREREREREGGEGVVALLIVVMLA